ncbi:hypothetical protein P154DRAFT_525677 [Amniculicola lignicola CBS 123094]|uniref:Uncharacterized protein n=1 Tax=Amniculicola lignicola CBS 123094 TaxID=1392246 RepID=A0A6A5W319_9PLEO|nr:hypothetical protein P154DRAFT_525677 [Amniculicola lignicola CBS 123094]
MDDKHERPVTEEVVSSNGHAHESAPPRKRGLMNTLYPPGPKPGAAPRVKNHCLKFWWCDCCVLIVIILVVVLPIIYVAIPHKAQKDINKSTLQVLSEEVTSPTSDSIHLKLLTVAKSSSSFHPTLDGFSATLSLKDKEPFLTIDIPKTKANAETNITVEQDLKISSMDRFTEYTMTVMGTESFDVYLNGKTTVHQKGLQGIDVDYNKVVTMKGLNKLTGLNITSIKILSGAKEILSDGSNMVGRVFIPNPSVLTLDLGNVTMDLAVDDTKIGYALLPNLILKPGDNNVDMQAHVDQLKVIQVITANYTTGVIPLSITGNSSVHTGQHLTYYEAAIKHNLVVVDLNVEPALAAVGINVTALTSGS